MVLRFVAPVPSMKSPSPSALIDRARTLVVRMHGVERWAYAIDAAVPADTIRAAILAAGYVLVEEAARAEWTLSEGPVRFGERIAMSGPRASGKDAATTSLRGGA